MTMPTTADRAEGRAPIAFLGFLALMTSVVAMTIDAVLPALDAISASLGFASANDRQLVVVVVFAGMGLSQPVFGALADGLGRRRAALLGWAVFVAGTLLAMAAGSAEALLAGRFLQGVGAGGPRIIAIAIVRDLYEGRPMARILSIVMTIFMLVPMFAPLIGQGVEALGGWRAIFGLYLAMALVSAGWYVFGVPETLAPENRRPLSLRPVAAAFAEVLRNRVAMCYTGAAICVFGPFMVYLATAQQVLEELYGLGPLFPVAFGALALAFALASFLNSRLVMALGMRRLSLIAITGLIAWGAVGSLATRAFAFGPVPPLWVFFAVMTPVFFCVAVLFANFNALALQPLGHIAGTGSAVVMSLSALGAAPIALVIARDFDGSLGPVFVAIFLLGIGGFLCMRLAEGGRET
ncbi:multidrug effflux MFS transporter [Paralimibaculum aggregatum]|uniref:Multidrug effflux MFS transporter n=1 Tax=Paralimibaculum aggregatum TaxID=3036245 RepID=A0ABQ6LSC0_9RHOB|nr:multidrug effflux MFS transporter [Limibaculum sp. NKW23]GMG84925.1 multidrug effflux MFS transporter [Limibaculum sp. NKW23]